MLLGRSASAQQGLARQALDAAARAVSVVQADLSDLDAVARAGDQISDEATPGSSTPQRSANHLAALALGEVYPELSGGYVELGRVRRSSPESYDPAREQQLWDVLEGLRVAPMEHSAAL